MILPPSEFDRLPATVQQWYSRWTAFMHTRVRFNMPDSPIHASAHCERVLLYALLIAYGTEACDDRARLALAHAAVFHDTRRLDDYIDRGHGARAAVYYADFCRSCDDISYLPEAAYAMRFHDIDDDRGRMAIWREFGPEKTPHALLVYAIFKDADALDRWRLGPGGIDVRYLRTAAARRLVGYARNIVSLTMDPEILKAITDEVNRTMGGGE